MQDRFVVVGVDPDTFATGVACLSGSVPSSGAKPEIVEVNCVATATAEGPDARGRLAHMATSVDDVIEEMFEDMGWSIDACVVEAQAHRPGDKRPDNIVQLAVVQGIVLGAIRSRVEEDCKLILPLPVQWKGTRSKSKDPKAILTPLGLSSDLSGVPGSREMDAKQRGHVITAIGLAMWGLEKLVTHSRIANFLDA